MRERISHEEALELLPWLVNGTLQASERQLVERHLRECLSCHSELKTQRALYAVVQEQPTIHYSAEQGFGRLLRRVNGERGETPRHGAAAFWSSRGGRAAPMSRLGIGALTLAALIGVAFWLVPAGSDRDGSSSYVTLTGEVGQQYRLDIIFAAGVTEEQMRALLQEIDATIVSGPSDVGRYTVRVEGVDLIEPKRAELVASLRNDPRVRFAGWTFMADASSAQE